MDLPVGLPRPPDMICFSGDEFLSKDFTVETFISQCKSRGASLEQLRDDLDIYFRVLKNSLIDMINTDYSEYIQVSQSMVGLDVHIIQTTGHIQQVQDKIIKIKYKVGIHLDEIHRKLLRHQELMEKRKNLQYLMQISELVKNFDFGQRFCGEQLPGLEKASIDISTLQHLLSRVHPSIAGVYEGRVTELRESLSSQLGSAFLGSIHNNEKESIRKCLKLYTSLGLQREAEDLFCKQIVHGFMSELITPDTLQELGLEQLYTSILEFIPSRCANVLRLTSEKSSGYDPTLLKMGVGFDSPFVHGYNFLARAVWPAITQEFIQNISDTFLVSDVHTFHNNYSLTLRFIEQFEILCETKHNVNELHDHESYVEFLEKWDLRVYYQLCFKEIAGLLEQTLDAPFTSPPPEENIFKLQIFSTLWTCLSNCWADNIFLLPLSHRFWKLTLQLLSRTASWSHTLNQITDLTVDTLTLLVHDFDIVVDEIASFCVTTIKPKLTILPQFTESILDDAITLSQREFSEAVTYPINAIVLQLAQHCIQPLEQAHSIPRLYRKTNKEQPSRSSSYVSISVQPLYTFYKSFSSMLNSDRSLIIMTGVIEQSSARYIVIINEVLTSVKRTEDSLLRIKQRTGSLVSQQSITPSNVSPAMTDDNKIRLQLAIDIEEFLKALTELIAIDSIEECKALVQCATNTRLEIDNIVQSL
ncbi:Conserved oligomeric Golgi complex subunit 2-like [Oopsacas minuta]|uniref:Conserved oligomeric Golgi complex subunit 2 n=1 Tax=Oopsacas minuta TaxID=111878 RepID=A0AAV7JAN8_9METZ|nr:Conserved oligomeric Golgi complex subunit 2-like [Oopsacas minuta]